MLYRKMIAVALLAAWSSELPVAVPAQEAKVRQSELRLVAD